MKRKRGSTSVMIRVFIQDNTLTTGKGLTGLAYDSVNLQITAQREKSATPTLYTGANIETITTIGTFQQPSSSAKCRFKEIDATNKAGEYEIHFHDDAGHFAVGDLSKNVQIRVDEITTTTLKIAPCLREIDLVAYDEQDVVRLGLTALPNAVADGAGGLPISDAGGLDIDAILADTNELQTDDYPTSIAAVKADTAAILVDTGTTLDGKIDIIDTNVDTLKAHLIIRQKAINDATPTTTKFITTLTETTNDYWNSGVILFTAGVNTGAIRSIKDYVGGTKEVTLNTALPVAPSNGDAFSVIMARAFKLAGLEAQEIRDTMKLAPSAGDPAAGSIDKHADDIKDALYDGKWVIDPTAKTLTIYKSDGITVLKVINLTSTSEIIPTFIQGVPQ